MPDTNTLLRVKRVIRDELTVDPDVIDATSTLESLGIDSLDSVQIVLDMEEEFGVKIPDSELPGIKTVGDVASCVEKYRGLPQ